MKKLISVKEKINNINSLVSQLKSSKLSLIEKDIILQTIRELYVEVSGFEIQENDLDNIVEKNIREPKTQIVEETPIVESLSEEAPIVEQRKPEIIEVQEVVEEKIIVEEPTKPVDMPKQSRQANLFGHTNQQAENKTVGEQLGQNKTSINDRLASNASNDISHRIAQKPITDIKSAIGIGDRFLYIRELFNGDNDMFEDVITYLNALNNFDEAESYLNEKYNLNSSNETAQSFINVVKRKFL